MHRTAAANHSSNMYKDETAPGARDGTKINASDRNALQEEICNAIEKDGATVRSEAEDNGSAYEQLGLAMGARGFVGDGSDGDHTAVDGSGFSQDGVYDTLTIEAGATVTTNSWVIRAKTAIIIEAGAVLELDGNDGSGSTPGAKIADGSLGGSEAGGVGGPDNATDGDPGGSTPAGAYAIGGNGGAGVDAASLGGAAGTVSDPSTLGTWRALPHAAGANINDAGVLKKLRGGAGGAGGGGDAGFGGGGGSGGGIIVLIAPRIINNGTIRARGGAGGDAQVGGDGAGGSGGGGGAIILITRTPAAELGTLDVSGGAGGGGADSNDGNAGAAGQTCVLSL